jgi:general secretion pathway protein M
MNKLIAWYLALQPRERRMVLIGGIVVGVLAVVGGILMPLESAVSNAVQARDTRRADLAWMNSNLPEVRAGSASLAPDTGEAPVVLVDRIGREVGLGTALRGTQPSGTGVRVQLEAAPFDTLVTWLATLEERHGLAIESISVDRAARPGLVNANITFAQANK